MASATGPVMAAVMRPSRASMDGADESDRQREAATVSKNEKACEKRRARWRATGAHAQIFARWPACTAVAAAAEREAA